MSSKKCHLWLLGSLSWAPSRPAVYPCRVYALCVPTEINLVILGPTTDDLRSHPISHGLSEPLQGLLGSAYRCDVMLNPLHWWLIVSAERCCNELCRRTSLYLPLLVHMTVLPLLASTNWWLIRSVHTTPSFRRVQWKIVDTFGKKSVTQLIVLLVAIAMEVLGPHITTR